MLNVAINGLGRIGRATLKILENHPLLDLVAINDLIPADNLAYLLKFDSVYGRWHTDVIAQDGRLQIGGKICKVFNERDPGNLPWRELNVALVFECTGLFRKAEDLAKHIEAGADYVILSAPAKSEDVPTVVHGVNTSAGKRLISCASCTTNCITPLVEIMGRRIGIRKAVMTTIHAYTATQAIVDSGKHNFRRGRAAAANLVPATTGAAIATTRAMPQYKGKFDGLAVRVPVPIGSLVDVVFLTSRATSVEEIKMIFREEAVGDRYREILAVTDEPIVSCDIVQQSYASIVDLSMIQVVDGDLVKIMSWYDNEWGYASQMVREAAALAEAVAPGPTPRERVA
jgi:glyceraldehyde 3-phosphate dehydrogenase